MENLITLHHDQVFSRGEALDHGYRDQDLRQAVSDGHLIRIRHGAYTLTTIWDAAPALERHRLRSHAVLRSHDTRLALSHTSAAIEHGLRLHQPDLSKIHVTCLDAPIGKSTHDIAYHRAPVGDGELLQTNGGELLVAPVRAAVESASLTSIAAGLVVLDSVVHLGHGSVEDVHRRFQTFHGPGAQRLQITVRLVREGAESVGESLARHMFWRQHIPAPVLQFEVRDSFGHLIGRTDFAWPEFGLLGEFDGMTKYGRLRRPGETVEQAVVREKKREDALREITGWLMIRFVWADLHTPAETARRLTAQLDRALRLRAA